MLDEQSHDEIKMKGPSRIMPALGVLLVLLSIGGYVFFTQGIAGENSELKVSVVEAEGRIDEAKQLIADYEAAEEEYGLTTQVQRYEVLKAVPADLDQDEVIRDLLDIANAYDIELHSLSFSKGASLVEEVGVLKINASFEGNYSDLTSFLEGLEENARMLQVSSISVQINTLDVANIKRATFSLTMDTYYQE